MRNGKYAAAQVQGDVLGGVAAMDTAAVELKLLDLAKLVRTAQECQHQSDVLHGLKEDQLAAGIEALQSQLQHVQRVVWATPGAGTAAAACSSSLLLAQRTDLQALEARLQALEADVARDTATAKEAAAAREQVERMLLERVIALEGSVAGGRAVRSAWAEQQDIRQLRRQLAELTDGVAGALSSLGLQPWLGAAAAEQAGSDEEVLDGSVEAGESGGTYAVDAGVEAEAHRQDQLSRASVAAWRRPVADQSFGPTGVSGSSAGQPKGAAVNISRAAGMPRLHASPDAPAAPPAAAARDDSGQTLRRSSASQPLPHLLQEAMERTAQAAAAAAVETYEARAAIQREVDAARVCALVDVVQSLGGAQRALAGQVEQLAGLCPRLLEALQQAKQRPPAVATGVGSDVGAGAAGGARDAQLEEAYMLAAEAGGLMAGLKKVLAEAMVLGADGAVRFSERLDAAVAGDVALQPMLEEAKVLRDRLAAVTAKAQAPSDEMAATVPAAGHADTKQTSTRRSTLDALRDTTNTLGHPTYPTSFKGTTQCKPDLSTVPDAKQQSPGAQAPVHVVPSALGSTGGSHLGHRQPSPRGAGSASSAVSVVSLAHLPRPTSTTTNGRFNRTLAAPLPQLPPQQLQFSCLHPYSLENAAEGWAVNLQALLVQQQQETAEPERSAGPLRSSYTKGSPGHGAPGAQQSGTAAQPSNAAEEAVGSGTEGVRTLTLSAALAAQVQAALQGLSASASLLHAGTAAAAGTLCGAAGTGVVTSVGAGQLLSQSAASASAAACRFNEGLLQQAPQRMQALDASSPAASSCDSQYSPRSGRSLARLRRQRQQAVGGATAQVASGSPAGRGTGSALRSPGRVLGSLNGAGSDAGAQRDEEDAWGWLSDDEQAVERSTAARASARTAPSQRAAGPKPRLRPVHGGAISASTLDRNIGSAAAATGRLKRNVGQAGAPKALGLKALKQQPSPPTKDGAAVARPPCGAASSLRGHRVGEPQGRRAASVEPSPARPAARRAQGASATAFPWRFSPPRATLEVLPLAGSGTSNKIKLGGKLAPSSKRRL